MKTVTVKLTETVERITEVSVPDDIHDLSVREYVENYIHGYIEGSYDYRVSDIVEDEIIIHDIQLEGKKLCDIHLS